MVKKKLTCGKCDKNITKSSKSVCCRGGCLDWFHLRCTVLSDADFVRIGKSQKKWACDSCTTSCTDQDNFDNDVTNVNSDLVQELESLNSIVKTLNEDLLVANKEIESLRKHNSNLEVMVLEKEGTIQLLERKIHCSNKKKLGKSYEVGRSCSHRQSLPLNLNKVFSNQNELFSTVVKKNNNNKAQIVSRVAESEFTFVSPNKFDVLQLEENVDQIQNNSLDAVVKGNKKMLICADSHGKNLAWTINENKNLEHEAVGFVKPNGLADHVLDSYNIKGEQLNADDVLVILCGTNDVSINKSQNAVNSISSAIENVNKKHTVVLVDLPNRYDLVEWSCVNVEVKKTNAHLKELSNKHSNVILVEASKAERRMHTRHGLHLNQEGKGWLARQICDAVNCNVSQLLSAQSPHREEEPLKPPGTESPSENCSLLQPNFNP